VAIPRSVSASEKRFQRDGAAIEVLRRIRVVLSVLLGRITLPWQLLCKLNNFIRIITAISKQGLRINAFGSFAQLLCNPQRYLCKN
jgi:hypothetical protein